MKGRRNNHDYRRTIQLGNEKQLRNYEIEIQYRDDGGDYSGTDNNIYCIVDTDNKKVIL